MSVYRKKKGYSLHTVSISFNSIHILNVKKRKTKFGLKFKPSKNGYYNRFQGTRERDAESVIKTVFTHIPQMDTPRCRKDISIPLQDILCPNVLATTEHKFLWYRCISTLICKDMTTVLYNWLSGSCLARALLEGEYFVFGESLRAQSRRFANIWLQSFGPKVASPTKNGGGA